MISNATNVDAAAGTARMRHGVKPRNRPDLEPSSQEGKAGMLVLRVGLERRRWMEGRGVRERETHTPFSATIVRSSFVMYPDGGGLA